MGEFNVVTIATDRETDAVKGFLKEHQLDDLPTLWDEMGRVARGKIDANVLRYTTTVPSVSSTINSICVVSFNTLATDDERGHQ